jgi:hypothetical protein
MCFTVSKTSDVFLIMIGGHHPMLMLRLAQATLADVVRN